jgi:hypothetical protein
MRISLNFSCKYRLNFAPHYVFITSPKMLVNLKSGRVINQVMKGGSIGYLIDSKFYTLTRLRECLEEVTNEDQPF